MFPLAASVALASVLAIPPAHVAAPISGGWAEALRRLAGERAHLGQMRRSAEASGDIDGVGVADLRLGRTLWDEDLADSVRHFRAALAEFECAGDEVHEARTIGPLLMSDLPEEEARRLGERGLTLARRQGDAESEARVLVALGERERRQGDFRQALPLLEQAMALVEYGDSPVRSLVLWAFGALFEGHGDFDRALDYFQEALTSQAKRHDLRAMAVTVTSIGTAHQLSGRVAQAEREFERAIAIARQAGSHRYVAIATINLADLRNSLHRPRSAATLLEQMFASRLDEDLRALAAVVLAQAYVDVGRASEAKALVETALRDPVERENVDMRTSAFLTLSRAYRAEGDSDRALAVLREGREYLERKRGLLVEEDALKQVYSSDQAFFAELVAQLFARHQGAAALEAAEEARARAFLDLLAGRALADTGASAERPPEGRPATFDDVVATARRLHSTVVSYFVSQTATFAWTVSPEASLRMVRIGWGERRLAAAVSAAQRENGGASARRARRSLYDALVAPVRGSLAREPGSRITIIPHGPLVLLSFAALRAPNGRYMIEDYSIHYAPAVGLFSYTSSRREGERDGGTLVVADPSPLPPISQDAPLEPLPGALREAKVVSALRPGAIVLTGREATKGSVAERAASAAVIHFATHALIVDKSPMDSFLALSTSGGDDGRLSAREVHQLRLRADLVVLSSCRSAAGRVSADGVLGLTRAFLASGASSVLASTWDVPDETQVELVRHFYQSRRSGVPKDRALRESQIHFLRALRAGRIRIRGPLGPAPAAPDPFFWAGLVLIGEP